MNWVLAKNREIYDKYCEQEDLDSWNTEFIEHPQQIRSLVRDKQEDVILKFTHQCYYHPRFTDIWEAIEEYIPLLSEPFPNTPRAICIPVRDLAHILRELEESRLYNLCSQE